MSPVLLTAALVGVQLTPVCREAGVSVARDREAPVVSIVAEGDFDAAPDAVLAILVDYDRPEPLAEAARETKVLARADRTLLVYQRLGLPLVADRDYTMSVSWGAEGAVRWARFATANEEGPPPREGIVRMPLHEADWRLVPGARGGTHATYTLRLDLGGSVPRWLVDGPTARHVPALFAAIRRRLAP
jgi:hypothetical protein